MCVCVSVANVCDVRPRFKKPWLWRGESSGLVKKKKKAIQLSIVHTLWYV